MVCGKVKTEGDLCSQNHFICSDCSELSALDFIRDFCVHQSSEDVLEMVIFLLRMCQRKKQMNSTVLGFLTCAALTGVYLNRKNLQSEKEIFLMTARQSFFSLDNCGTDCFAVSAPALGLSYFLRLVMKTEGESDWRVPYLEYAGALESMAAYPANRCLIREVYISVLEALKFLRENYGLIFTHRGVHCEFSKNNMDCSRGHCPFGSSTYVHR